MNKAFIDVAVKTESPWTDRPAPLYEREGDIRNPFERDYTRILHSNSYRRLKHKTQVFYNIDNDHVCTRIEHVSHVESVSSTIAQSLGLNEDLTRAIATGHDLGHAPFGHQGEKVLNEISEKYLNKSFWHEQNGVRFVDYIELLPDAQNFEQNLNLTYAVRDGIISHCGEVDENGLRPRSEQIDLKTFTKPGMYQPATWEGCVVKISDKIAYVGRDIEDALHLGFLRDEEEKELRELAKISGDSVLNTTIIMNNLIQDICQNSNPEIGITLSETSLKQLNDIKKFNYSHIYLHEKLKPYIHYSELVLHELFNVLYHTWNDGDFWSILDRDRNVYRSLIQNFEEFLAHYANKDALPKHLHFVADKCKNVKIYGNIDSIEIFVQAILDFIAGMTDSFALKLYNELLTY